MKCQIKKKSLATQKRVSGMKAECECVWGNEGLVAGRILKDEEGKTAEKALIIWSLGCGRCYVVDLETVQYNYY